MEEAESMVLIEEEEILLKESVSIAGYLNDSINRYKTKTVENEAFSIIINLK